MGMESFDDLKDGIKGHVSRSYESYKGYTFGFLEDGSIDHRIPLIICVFVYIPAITLVFIRDWFRAPVTEQSRFSIRTRCVVAYMITFACASTYIIGTNSIEEVIYGRIYIVTATFTPLYLILLSYGRNEVRGVRIRALTAYIGAATSFLGVTAEYYYQAPDVAFVAYDIGLAVFVVGIVFTHLSAWRARRI